MIVVIILFLQNKFNHFLVYWFSKWNPQKSWSIDHAFHHETMEIGNLEAHRCFNS